MLENLHVKNLALIKEEEINFKKGLNILTGETGAGKSILIGSINIALGAKASPDIIRKGEKEALIELIFSVEDDAKIRALSELGVADIEEKQLIISRKISPTKSISKVNGETVTLAFIKKITSLLMDIHGQHEHQSLLYKSNHLLILDKYIADESAKLKADTRELYKKYVEYTDALKDYDIDDETRLREVSFLEFEINEIKEAHLLPGEEEELSKKYKKLSNAKRIYEEMSRVSSMLSEDTSERISLAVKSASAAGEFDEDIKPLVDSVYDLENMFEDCVREVNSYIDHFEFDEEAFSEITERINTINNLKQKYGNSIESILKHLEESEQKLIKLTDYEHNKALLDKKISDIYEKLSKNAELLSDIRKKAAKKLTKLITEALMDLNFNNVEFVIAFEKNDKITANGFDSVEFMISTNAGEPVKPLLKVASGGELSRIMLALKAVLANKDSVDTLIFDEIDTGISGITAQKVADKMSLIAKSRQVIAITHLPQIAAKADTHFLIEKKMVNSDTVTGIVELSEEESVMELCRIIGGEHITDAVISSAKEMKELAKKQ